MRLYVLSVWWCLLYSSKRNTHSTIQKHPTVNTVNELTTRSDTAQRDAISEHHHPNGLTPTRGHNRIEQEHTSTKSIGKKTRNQGHSNPPTTQHTQGEVQRTGLRTTTDPYLPRTPPPPTNNVIVWFLFMYFVLLTVPVLYHSVLTDSYFGSVC